MGQTPHDKLAHRETLGQGRIQDTLRALALRHGIWIVGGTIPLVVPAVPNKVYAACMVFNAQGDRVAEYNKIHLFDVDLPLHQEYHRESETIAPGSQITVVATPVGKLGLAICYDLRFPELFRSLQAAGAEIIALPAAFTVPTGLAHWEILLRARAIENQVYLLAAAQTGTHPNLRKTYGHSMLVDPWGKIVTQLAEETGVLTGDIDLHYLQKLRMEFPVLQHRK